MTLRSGPHHRQKAPCFGVWRWPDLYSSLSGIALRSLPATYLHANTLMGLRYNRFLMQDVRSTGTIALSQNGAV